MRTYRRGQDAERIRLPPERPAPKKARKPAGALEKHIQQMIVQYLKLTGWTVWEMYKGSDSGGMVWVTPGIPDLYVFQGSRWIWLEVKRPKVGKLSPGQHLRHAELAGAALPFAVVTSLEDVQAALAGL